jgi:hypothetical protein
MTIVVIAATDTLARQRAKQAGISQPVTMTPYGIKHYGCRGLIADLVLVDDSALPLDDHTLEHIGLMRLGRNLGRNRR